MRFGEPQWLWLMAVIPLLGLLLAVAHARRRQDLARWCGAGLWGRLVPDAGGHLRVWKALLVLAAVASLAVMAARPQLGSRTLAVKRTGVDVIVALDLSESMLAEDLAPNRLVRARQGVHSLIDRLRGDRIGLVAFAGEAFVQCPLTLDYAAARMFLRFMDTDLVAVPGTSLAQAIRTSVRGFDPTERKHKALVLITDGEDHEGNLMEAAREAREAGVRIFAVGIGSAKGEPIPVRNPGGVIIDHKRDARGEVVLTRLDDASLRRIAAETGGRYLDGSAGGLALDQLYAEISGMEGKELKGAISIQHEDRFGYFAAAALLLLTLDALLGERRRSGPRPRRRRSGGSSLKGFLPAAALTLLNTLFLFAAALLWTPLLPSGWPCSSTAAAGDPGRSAYKAGRFEEARAAYERYAAEHPEDPRGSYNLGTARHMTGELKAAEESLMQALRSGDPKLAAAAHYNLGNTRARGGDLEGALEAYESALRLRPSDGDAKHNLELVRMLMHAPPPDSGGTRQPSPDGSQCDDGQDGGGEQDRTDGDQQEQRHEPGSEQDGDGAQDRDGEQDCDGEQDDNGEQDGDETAQEDPSPDDGDHDGQGQAHELPEARITPEQARQILEGLSQQEMLLQAERLRSRSRSLSVEMDW